MKVVLDTGTTVDLGKVEATPTVGIIDYSRRSTDDFGVTTVVQRGFSRRMSLRIAVPIEELDTVQRQLVDLRAKPATWIADARYGSLSFRGFYKDFDFTVGALSLYTLTVESIVSAETFVDPGTDPASSGKVSSLRFLDPVVVDGNVLVSSSVPETDAPSWAAGTTYAKGQQVIVPATHRIYESLVAGNVGADPTTTAAKWLDVGPTNRWAAFDQALGTSTIIGANVEVVLKSPNPVSGLALLDTNAATVRLRAPGYDRTLVPDSAGKALFLDFAAPAGTAVTVTATPAAVIPGPQRWDDGARWLDQRVWSDSLAAGDGTVTIGTMLIGQLRGLGVTEIAPTAGIIDYSRKETDEFGEITVIPRAWAKRMATKALIRTDAVDLVMNRLAAARAKPCLWLGHDDLDALAVYGFYKDFDIAVAPSVSKLSLSIEGLSSAAPLAKSLTGAVDWPNVGDPDGTKPTDNADKTSENTSKDTAAVGGRPATGLLALIDEMENVAIPAIQAAGAAAGQRITEARAAADLALDRIENEVERVDGRIDNLSASGGYDDTAIKASITDERELSLGRDAALGTRIDTVTASVSTTDTNLRALIQTKETAAVGREDAISQRIDQLIAEGGGGSEGVDAVARSEISRVEQAAVLGQTALSGRATVLEASVATASGVLNGNPSFAVWPAAPDNLPYKWGFWSTGFSVEKRGRTDGASGNYARLSIGAGADGGLQDNFLMPPGWYVLEADVQLVSGSYTGAGMTIAGEVSLHFATEPDSEGVISSTSQTRRRFSKIVQLGGQRNAWHLMMNWSAWPLSAKTIDWHRCSVRPASDAEIKAQRAFATDIPAVAARIKTTEDTLADLPNRYATAQRASTIEAMLGNVADSGLRTALAARIEDRATAIADAKSGAVAQTVATLRSEYNGTAATVSQQAGTIADVNYRTRAYMRSEVVAGNNRALVNIYADSNLGAGVSIVGDVAIDGNLTVTGTLPLNALNRGQFSRYGQAEWFSGASPVTPGPGQKITLINNAPMGAIGAEGSFTWEVFVVFTTNAGEQTTQQNYNGTPYPLYTEFRADGGIGVNLMNGAASVISDVNPDNPRGLGRIVINGSGAFNATLLADIFNNNYDSGVQRDGDYFRRVVSATYRVYSVQIKARWTFI